MRRDTLEVMPKDEDILYRVEFDWEKVARISVLDALTGELIDAGSDDLPGVALRF